MLKKLSPIGSAHLSKILVWWPGYLGGRVHHRLWWGRKWSG